MYTQLNKRFGNAIVMLARKNGENVDFIGTGFLASNRGHILTCSHIINPTDSIVAIKTGELNQFSKMTLGRVNLLATVLVQNDPINDVALLKFQGDVQAQIPPSWLGNSEKIECGSSIALIGFPFGNSGLHIQSLTHGIISAKAITNDGVKVLQFDSMIHQGNSGGPLIDLKSNAIIGVVTNRFNPTPGGSGIVVGGHQLGQETNISYASVIEYGIELLNNEID